MNKIIKLIILYGIKCLFNESSFATGSITFVNHSGQTIGKGAVRAWRSNALACNDWWNGADVKNGESWSWDAGGWQCCFSKFNVFDTMFYIPNPCVSHEIRLEKEDGQMVVYIDGSKARVYGDIGGFFKDVGTAAGGAFKDLGNDINKGFQKFGSCMEVATLSTEYAAKYAALQTVLSGKLTDAMVTAAQETAIQPLYAARDAAKGVLETAKQFLEKVAKPIATGTISAAQQSASNFLTAGETTATGVLTAADAITKGVLGLFDIQKIHYEGSLQEFAKGNLGNVSCNAIILEQKVDFNFDMNIKDPTKGIEKLANKIADKVVEVAKQIAKGMKLSAHTLHIPDDVLKLTMWHHTKQYIPLERLASNT